MCGIVGVAGPNPSRKHLQQLADLLVHRGPDEAGDYVGPEIGLAARRLSIIDIGGGSQPIGNEDGSIRLVYNGEVYNAPALRSELAAAGHAFSSRTDTEVVVHAYEQWGDDAVARLRGMFAFGLWDARRRRLLLARDRFGIKPLYYARSGGLLAFASEVRPVLAALPALPRRASAEALWRMFELGFIPAPLSAFDGVRKLPAAHLLTCELEHGQIAIRPYWRLRFPPGRARPPGGDESAAAMFVERLRETVEAWRLSDVPVGSLLSGGVDSASLAALLAEVAGEQIHTFTIGFTAGSHDESALARETARALGSRHHELTFADADFDSWPRVVRCLEEPQCSATSVPLYLLYRACHEAGFKVIMTGEGADELLGGYHWFEGDRRIRPLLWLPQPVRALLSRAPLPASAAARRVLARGTDDPAQRYLLWQQVADREQLGALLLSAPAAPYDLGGDGSGDPGQGVHPLDRFLYFESQTRMIDFINFEVDRMSMASSVEARPPFLDHLLWEFCASLPPESKLSPGGDKRLLRAGMKGRLPPAVLAQPKRGLAAPHARWWRAARLPDWAEQALGPAALGSSGYFRAAEVARLRALHRAGRADVSRLLSGVLTTQLWHEEFIAGPGSA